MKDNFRIVEYLSTPSQLFSIYDYTKLAYLTDNYICIRELVTPDISPAFIKISNQHPEQPITKRYIGIVGYSNLIILGEKAITRDIYLHFHQINDSCQIKVMS